MSETDAKQESIAQSTVDALQGLAVIAITYNWLAASISLLGSVLAPMREGALLPRLFDFPIGIGPLFPPIWWPIWHCILVGFITYVVIRWVCERRWVARTYVVRDCIQINPFGAIICFLRFVTHWVVVIICRWVRYIIAVPIWICFIVWLWRLF